MSVDIDAIPDLLLLIQQKLRIVQTAVPIR